MPYPAKVAQSIFPDFPGIYVEYSRVWGAPWDRAHFARVRLSGIPVTGIPDHRIALEQLAYAVIK